MDLMGPTRVFPKAFTKTLTKTLRVQPYENAPGKRPRARYERIYENGLLENVTRARVTPVRQRLRKHPAKTATKICHLRYESVYEGTNESAHEGAYEPAYECTYECTYEHGTRTLHGTAIKRTGNY